MERTRQIKNPDLIITSDWHLREDIPTCFTGDFQKEQWDSVNFVKQLQAKYNCPVVHAGDLFHHWKPSPWLLSQTIDLLPKQFYSIYGQHDLPQHNWELRRKSGLYTLSIAGKLTRINDGNYGQEIKDVDGLILSFVKERTIRILVWHHLTYINPPFPDVTGGNAMSILKKYSQFDLIITGDNHQSFFTECKGRLLINPGSLTRQTADQMDFQPHVALWYAKTNIIEWVNIPIQQGVITREHIEKAEQRDGRIDAFISRLNKEYEIGMSFEQNLEVFLSQNQIRESVKNIIYKSIE